MTSIIPAVEFVPGNYFAPLDLAQIFPRAGPLEVDLGCGDGAFLIALAEQTPERNFLGIERLLGRVRSATGRAARRGLPNVRLLRVEAAYAVHYLLPPASVAVAHLLFPDPWPKQRHHRRRLVTAEFVAAIARVLAPGGRFRIATDEADYFETIQERISLAPFRRAPSERAYPPTTFEKRFVAKSAEIYRLELVKIS